MYGKKPLQYYKVIILQLIKINKKINYHTIALISHISKVMLKILQARLQQYMNCELPDVQVGFRKGRRTRDQVSNIHWIIDKAREIQRKHLLLLHCASFIAQLVKNLPAVQETPVRFLGQEDPLEKEQATHSSILGFPLWLSW